jgi:hypothetical protein
MHYVTRRSHQMQKHKFRVKCPGMLFMETASSPPEHENLCIDVLRHGPTGMHYVTRRSHRMQKHKFGIMCSDVVFTETTLGDLSMKIVC